MGKFQFHFTKDHMGFFYDEISEGQIRKHLELGWLVETIEADHRWQAYKLVEERNCELAHTIAGEGCTCGSHSF